MQYVRIMSHALAEWNKPNNSQQLPQMTRELEALTSMPPYLAIQMFPKHVGHAFK